MQKKFRSAESSNEIRFNGSHIKGWCILNITKLKKPSQFIRRKNQPTSVLIIMSKVEDHFVELDCNANIKNHLKINQSVEVNCNCITNQTVLHFEHHRTEKIKPFHPV